MSVSVWKAVLPANIALIKYMGKTDADKNQPANASLSYTLAGLLTTVTLEAQASGPCFATGETKAAEGDRWLPFSAQDIATVSAAQDVAPSQFLFLDGKAPVTHAYGQPLSLSVKAQTRFLNHLAYIKRVMGYTGHFIVRSGNNFPQSCGLASSASSFAALTLCAAKAICQQQNKPLPSLPELAALSRQGSGSSCRSFFSPWALWTQQGAHEIALPYASLRHLVIVVSDKPKRVSSSQAHTRVLTSPHFQGRPQRAEQRLHALLQALKNKAWDKAFQITWDEFQDMHTLFRTAVPHFDYATPALAPLLQYLKARWDNEGDGPLITMDAGSTVHLLLRHDQSAWLDDLPKPLSKVLL